MAPPIALPPPLDAQLCFQLYSASLEMTRLYKPMLDRLGITYPQYLLLATLWEGDGLSIGAIAERLGLEPSTITPLAKRLEASGLVERRRAPDDERRVDVRLTDAGRALQKECGCLAEAVVATSGLALDELLGLAGEVRRFRDAILREPAAA